MCHGSPRRSSAAARAGARTRRAGGGTLGTHVGTLTTLGTQMGYCGYSRWGGLQRASSAGRRRVARPCVRGWHGPEWEWPKWEWPKWEWPKWEREGAVLYVRACAVVCACLFWGPRMASDAGRLSKCEYSQYLTKCKYSQYPTKCEYSQYLTKCEYSQYLTKCEYSEHPGSTPGNA